MTKPIRYKGWKMPIRYKSAEEVIEGKRAADAERLRQLENFKRNIESGIVFDLDIDKDLMEILLNWNVKDL